MIRAIYREAYDLKKCAHVGHLARLVETRENAYEGLQRLGVIYNDAVRDHRMFPSFQTRGIDGYNGKTPSQRYLQSLFVQTTHGDIVIYETLMALNADTDILSADDSYKVNLVDRFVVLSLIFISFCYAFRLLSGCIANEASSYALDCSP